MERTRFIVAGSLIDGSGGAVLRHIFLKVQDSIIAAIGPAAGLPANDRALIHDFSHCTIVRTALEKAGIAKKTALAARHIRYCHTHGVLGVADSDDTDVSREHLRELMPEGKIIDIKTSRRPCLNSQDCATGLLRDRDFLRIIYTGGIGNGKLPESRPDPEELYRILQQWSGKKAVVVANGPQRVEEALAAGCDAIEQGYGMGLDNLRKMAETGVLWIPSVLTAKSGLDNAGSGGDVTCRFSMRYVAPGKADPGAVSYWKKMLADQLAQLRYAGKLGVKTALGTGAGSPGILHGESMVEEMKLFIRAGWSLEETIRCAAENGAGFFGMDDLGALAGGRKATFLVAGGAAQQLPRKLAYLKAIYVDGAPSRFF